MHHSTPSGIISASCFICAVLFDAVCLHVVKLMWDIVSDFRSPYSTSVPRILHQRRKYLTHCISCLILTPYYRNAFIYLTLLFKIGSEWYF